MMAVAKNSGSPNRNRVRPWPRLAGPQNGATVTGSHVGTIPRYSETALCPSIPDRLIHIARHSMYANIWQKWHSVTDDSTLDGTGWNIKVLWSMWSHHTAIHRHEWRTLHVHVGFEASLPTPSTFRFLKLNFSLLENVHVACSSLVYCWQVRLQPALPWQSTSTFKPSPSTVSWYKTVQVYNDHETESSKMFKEMPIQTSHISHCLSGCWFFPCNRFCLPVFSLNPSNIVQLCKTTTPKSKDAERINPTAHHLSNRKLFGYTMVYTHCTPPYVCCWNPPPQGDPVTPCWRRCQVYNAV